MTPRDHQAEQDHAEWHGWMDAQGYDFADDSYQAEAFAAGMQAERDLAAATGDGTLRTRIARLAETWEGNPELSTEGALLRDLAEILRDELHHASDREPQPSPELAGQAEDQLADAERTIDSYRDEVSRILAEIDRERTTRLHLAAGRDEARSDFSRLRRVLLEGGQSDAAVRKRCLAIIATAGTPPVDVPLDVQRTHRPGACQCTPCRVAAQEPRDQLIPSVPTVPTKENQ